MGQKKSRILKQLNEDSYPGPKCTKLVEMLYEDESNDTTTLENELKLRRAYTPMIGSPVLSETTSSMNTKTPATTTSYGANGSNDSPFNTKTANTKSIASYGPRTLNLSSAEGDPTMRPSLLASYQSKRPKSTETKGSQSTLTKSYDIPSDSSNQFIDDDLDFQAYASCNMIALESEDHYRQRLGLSPNLKTRYKSESIVPESHTATKSYKLSKRSWHGIKEEQITNQTDDQYMNTDDLPIKLTHPYPRYTCRTEFPKPSCEVCYTVRNQSPNNPVQFKQSKSPASLSSSLQSRTNTLRSRGSKTPIMELSYAMDEISAECLDVRVHHSSSPNRIYHWVKQCPPESGTMLQNEPCIERVDVQPPSTLDLNDSLTKPDRNEMRLLSHPSRASIDNLEIVPHGDEQNVAPYGSSNISITARSANWCGRKSPSLVLFTLRPTLSLKTSGISEVGAGHLNAPRKVGLTNLEGQFVGGNVTSNTRQNQTTQRPNTAPTLHRSQTINSDISSPITKAVYVYSYRFWITCEKRLEKVFKNPFDRRIESIGRLSDCRIRLTSTFRRNAQGFVQRMVNIIAPSAAALQKCCKLFDDKFPEFYASSGLLFKDDELANPSNFGIRKSNDPFSKRPKRTTCSSQSVRRRNQSVPRVRKSARNKSVSCHNMSRVPTNSTSLVELKNNVDR